MKFQKKIIAGILSMAMIILAFPLHVFNSQGMLIDDRIHGEQDRLRNTKIASMTNAVFSATGENSGFLTQVDSTMVYSIDGGNIWNVITSEEESIVGITLDNGIQVKYASVSDAQYIPVTKAPIPTTVRGGEEIITGVNEYMEYKMVTDPPMSYRKITGNMIENLAVGTYLVREQPLGTKLASGPVQVVVYPKKEVNPLLIQPIEEKTYGDQPFEVNTSGGTGSGTVLFSSSDSSILSFTGNIATIHKAGRVTITAKKEMDGILGGEVSTITIDINKKQLNVIAVDTRLRKSYTMPSFAYATEGIVGTDRFTVPPVLTTTATTTHFLGTFDILVHGGVLQNAESYQITYVTGILTIYSDSSSSGSGGSGGGGGGSSSGSVGPSVGTHASPQSTTSVNVKKGHMDSVKGIVTGTSAGYSRWEASQPIYNAEGIVVDQKWKLRYADGTYATGIVFKDINNNPYEKYEWELINGGWYLFGLDGYVRDGFVYDAYTTNWYYIDINTGMKTGWQYIEGSWYYFNPNVDGTTGKLLTNTTTPDGYIVDHSGRWIQ